MWKKLLEYSFLAIAFSIAGAISERLNHPQLKAPIVPGPPGGNYGMCTREGSHLQVRVFMGTEGLLWGICGSCGKEIPLRYAWGTNHDQAKIHITLGKDSP